MLAGTVRPSDEHVCKMAGMEMMTAMQMPTASPSSSQSHEMMPGMEMPTASPSLSHSHEMMPGMEMTAGMETMPCCMKQGAQSVSSQSGSEKECCVNIPQETGSSGTTFILRLPSFNVAVIHPAIVQPYNGAKAIRVFLLDRSLLTQPPGKLPPQSFLFDLTPTRPSCVWFVVCPQLKDSLGRQVPTCKRARALRDPS